MGPGLAILYASSFSFNLGAAMAILAVTLYAIELGATPLQLGMIGMVWPATFSVSALFVGPLSDRIPRKVLPVVGAVIGSASFLAVNLASSPLHIMMMGVPAGLAFSFVWPPIEAWVAELSSASDMRRNIGIFNLSWSIGAAPGSLLAGLAFRIGIGISLATSVSFLALAGLMIAIKGKEPQDVEHPATVQFDDEAHSRAYLHLAWIANFATYFTIGIMRSLFPKLGEQLGMGTASIGGLLSLITFSQVIAFFILARTSSWHYRLTPMLISQFTLVCASLLVYTLSGVVQLAPVMVIMGSCTGLSYYSSIYYSLNTPTGKGARSGVHEALIGMGIVAGPLTGGIVAQRWGLRSPFLVSAIVIIMGIATTAALGSKLRTSIEPPPMDTGSGRCDQPE